MDELPDRVRPEYSRMYDFLYIQRNVQLSFFLTGLLEILGIQDSKLLNLGWAENSHPRNILLIKKPGVGTVRVALLEFARYEIYMSIR